MRWRKCDGGIECVGNDGGGNGGGGNDGVGNDNGVNDICGNDIGGNDDGGHVWPNSLVVMLPEVGLFFILPAPRLAVGAVPAHQRITYYT